MGRARQSSPVAASQAAGEPVAEAATVRLVATQPIRHDGRDYPPGATLEVPAADAEALVALGAAAALLDEPADPEAGAPA